MSKYIFTRILAAGFIIAGLIFQSSCNSEKDQTELLVDAMVYEFDIIDSLMIDYLGSMSWSDISKDGKHILALDNQNSDILLFSSEGKVLGTFNKSGDQPDGIGGNPLSRPQFVRENEWAILGKNGVSAFDYNGELKRKAKPDFTVSISLSISNANILHFIDEERALVYYMGRDNNSSYFVSPTSSQLEMANLKEGDFTATLPIPEGSKYKDPEKIHNVLTAMPAMTINDGKLYISFKNEPKLWIYDLKDLSTPVQEINILFDEFMQKEGVAPEEADDKNVGINIKDFTYGSIDKLIVHDEKILIFYHKGISDREYDELQEGLSNPNDILSKVFKTNKNYLAILKPDGGLIPMELPDRVGSIEFIDNNGNYWLSYNREEELDYELIFKAKLKAVK
jgi:hypothetical protein